MVGPNHQVYFTNLFKDIWINVGNVDNVTRILFFIRTRARAFLATRLVHPLGRAHGFEDVRPGRQDGLVTGELSLSTEKSNVGKLRVVEGLGHVVSESRGLGLLVLNLQFFALGLFVCVIDF